MACSDKNSSIPKPKLKELPLIFWRFFENSCILTHMYGIRLSHVFEIPTIIFIIFWDSLMFYQIFFSPQVRRCAIITYKHSIYGLSNDLRKWVNNQFHNILRLFDALPNFSLTASENMRHDYPQTRHKWAAPRENQSPKKTKKYQETAPTMKDQPQAPHQNESPTNTSRKLLKNRN